MTKHIEQETLETVARLARLNLTREEQEQFRTDLEHVLDAFTVLDTVETGDVEPAFHPIDIDRDLRPDDRAPTLPQVDALENADESNTEDDYFKGPRAV